MLKNRLFYAGRGHSYKSPFKNWIYWEKQILKQNKGSLIIPSKQQQAENEKKILKNTKAVLGSLQIKIWLPLLQHSYPEKKNKKKLTTCTGIGTRRTKNARREPLDAAPN